MALRSRSLAWVALASAAMTLLTVGGSAQEAGTYPTGASYLTEGLEVKAGETLSIGPGTSITGPGNITVWGTLLVHGTAGSPAEFGLQIRVLSGGRADLQQARLWGVPATALEVFGGEVTLQDVLFEANARAALVKGSSRFSANDTVFRDHAGEALYVEEAAEVDLEGATFNGNGRGVTVYSARSFHANNSTFVANGQHVVVDLGPWSLADGDITLTNNTFRAPAPTPAKLPSILLRFDPTLVDEADARVLTLGSNRIEGAPVGMRVEGRALVIDSTNDTLVDNDIGLSVQLSTVQLDHATLGNDRDVEGSGRVTLLDATYLRSPGSAPADAEQALGRVTWMPWALGGAALALLVGAAIVVPRARRGAPVVVSPLEEPVRLPVAPPVDLSAPLTPTERRILDDVLQHPGTAQRAIADRLGYTRQALHYHVKKLEARGLVAKRVEGRETRCEVPPAVASLLAATRTGSEEKS